MSWVGACDFVVRLIGKDPAPGKVARRLIGLSREQAKVFEAVRIGRRIVPRRTAVQVTLADGTGIDATIVNLSASGIALALDAPLAVGQEIVVGFLAERQWLVRFPMGSARCSKSHSMAPSVRTRCSNHRAYAMAAKSRQA